MTSIDLATGGLLGRVTRYDAQRPGRDLRAEGRGDRRIRTQEANLVKPIGTAIAAHDRGKPRRALQRPLKLQSQSKAIDAHDHQIGPTTRYAPSGLQDVGAIADATRSLPLTAFALGQHDRLASCLQSSHKPGERELVLALDVGARGATSGKTERPQTPCRR
jgi:hypothetical protein